MYFIIEDNSVNYCSLQTNVKDRERKNLWSFFSRLIILYSISYPFKDKNIVVNMGNEEIKEGNLQRNVVCKIEKVIGNFKYFYKNGCYILYKLFL